jgi:hypothetical protein
LAGGSPVYKCDFQPSTLFGERRVKVDLSLACVIYPPPRAGVPAWGGADDDVPVISITVYSCIWDDSNRVCVSFRPSFFIF